MKHRRTYRTLILVLAGSLLLIIAGLSGLRTWIGRDVKKNIALAKSKYPGTAEQALTAFLTDGENSCLDRTHTAIWTLGQIGSETALPMLKELYRDDPKGETCYGKHDSMLCQYEIYKAIRNIEGFRIFNYSFAKEDHSP